MKSKTDSRAIMQDNLTRSQMQQGEAVEFLQDIQAQWLSTVHDLEPDPITTEWWIYTFGEWPDPTAEDSYLMTWPQAGATWLGMRWVPDRRRVELVIGSTLFMDGTEWKLSSWLLHIRTRRKLGLLLGDLTFRKLNDGFDFNRWDGTASTST